MVDSNYDILRNYFGQKAGVGNADIAKFIALNAKPRDFGPQAGKGNEPSIMGRIFDILSRPNYAVAESVRQSMESGQVDLSTMLEGLSGKRKTTFSKVLEEAGLEDKGARAGLGFIADVFLDPTTYIPFAGIASKLASKGGKAAKIGEAAEKPAQASLVPTTKAPEVFKPIERVTDILPKAGEIIPGTAPVGQLQFPLDVIPTAVRKTAPVGKAAKQPTGQIPLKFPGLNIKKAAEQTAKDAEFAARLEARAPAKIAQLEAGSIRAAAEMTPLPPPRVTPKQQALAESLVVKLEPAIAKAGALDASQQVKLFREARAEAAKAVGRRKMSKTKAVGALGDATIKIYNAAESALIAKGYAPRIASGEKVKLSDVLAQFTLEGKALTDEVIKQFSGKIDPGSPLWKTVEVLRARGAIEEAPVVKNIVDKVSETSTAIKTSGVLSEVDQSVLDNFLKRITKTGGLSPAAEKAADKLTNMALTSGRSAAQIALDTRTKMLDDIIATGQNRAKANNVVTKALEKDLGTLPAWAVNENKAMEFMMGRFATWWGQSDLRPLSLMAIGSAHATAATRGKVLDNLFKPFNEAQRHEALKVIQGTARPSTPEVSKLAQRLQVILDNLCAQANGKSVLLRSGLDRDMLNKWMREYHVGFQFIKDKTKNLVGETVDFSKGTDWLNCWKVADIKEDPKVFIFKLQEAIEQATREKALFDEIGERFGSINPGKGYKVKIEGHPYLKDYYFTQEIAQQIPRVIRDWAPSNWKSNSPLMRHYDRVLSMIKSGLTIYRPGHHIRNYVGDVYLGWMDGVNTLRPYTLAAQVQKSMRGAYQTIADVDDLVKLGAMPKSMGTPKPNQTLFRNKSGVAFTAEQIGAAAHQRGLLEHAKTLEDIIDMGTEGGKKSVLDVQPLGGRVQAVARGTSELFSHNTRLAHFIDKVMKSRGDDLPKIFEEAANRSRKWHPTGLDLTDFEKKYMRRIMPFYSWMRKSLPLLIEGMVMNPGKTVIPAKAYDAIQEMAGIETPGRHDPFPVDQMFPEWIRQSGAGPVGLPEGLLGAFSNQEPPGYVMAGMGLNPLTELIAQLENPGKTIGSALTPAAQIPMELLTGRKIFTGEPITGPEARQGAFQQWVGEQVPIFSAVQGVTGITPFGTETGKSKKSGGEAGTEAFLNWLTGAGIRGTGPYISQGQYEFRQPAIMERRSAREDFLRRLRDANS